MNKEQRAINRALDEQVKADAQAAIESRIAKHEAETAKFNAEAATYKTEAVTAATEPAKTEEQVKRADQVAPEQAVAAAPAATTKEILEKEMAE